MNAFSRPARALVREVASSFAACLRADAAPTIDVERARAQHAAYVSALRALSIAVEAVEPDDALPDGCFVEDTAVILGEVAVLTIPGAPARQPETRTVAPALERHAVTHVMGGDARLDGGDVLRVNDVLFVGLSSRTNEEGAELLSEVARREGLEVRTVRLATGLHLKSICTLVDPETLVVAPSIEQEARAALAASGCALIDAPEEVGANVLALGRAILASASAPRTVALLRARGLSVVALELTELHKADGALTCLSLRVPPPGGWCA